MTCPTADGNRNALLALHFGEGDARTAAGMRVHAETCAACRGYLGALARLEGTLTKWEDDQPPAGMGQAILARATRGRQLQRHMARPRGDALPLVGLLPVMAALLDLIRRLAAWLPDLWFWPELGRWPALETVLPFAAAAAVLLAVGGLASLAAAPALMLETRRQET